LLEHLARDSFLSSLDDPEMKLKVREREPEGLESAVKLAQQFVVLKGAVEATSSTSRRYNRAVTEENCNSQCGAVAPSGGDCESHHASSKRLQGFNRNRLVSNQAGTNEDQGWKQDIMHKIGHLKQTPDKSLAENKKIAAENAELKRTVDYISNNWDHRLLSQFYRTHDRRRDDNTRPNRRPTYGGVLTLAIHLISPAIVQFVN
jgi:hypothetical protein